VYVSCLQNGETDDTAAFQAAIAAIPQRGVMYIPPGTYLLSAPLNITRPIVLRGAGPNATLLQFTTSLSALYGGRPAGDGSSRWRDAGAFISFQGSDSPNSFGLLSPVTQV
jgi:hypothetical protein